MRDTDLLVTRMSYEYEPAPTDYVWVRLPNVNPYPPYSPDDACRALCCLSCGALVGSVDLHTAIHRQSEDTGQ